MPQILETDIGEIELPDEFTPEQIQEFAKTKLPRFRKRIALEEEGAEFERERERPTIRKTVSRLGLGLGTEGPPEVRRGFYGLGETTARMFEETRGLTGHDDPVDLFMKGVRALTRRISGEKVKSLADAPAELRAQATKEAEQARELGAAVGGGKIGELAQQFGTTATVSGAAIAPAILGAPVAGPMGAVAISAATAGLQQGGSSYASVKDKLLREKVPEQEAEELARHFGAVSGLITAAVTRGFGQTGLEAFTRGATAGGFRRKVLEILKDSALEGGEETTDQILQSLWEKASASPEKPWKDLVHETLIAGSFGAILGGAVGVGRETIGKTAERVAGEAELLAERFRRPDPIRTDLTARALASPDVSGRPQEAPEAIAEGFIRLQREREAAEQAAQPSATQAQAYPYQGPVQPDRPPLAPVQPDDVPDPVNASDLVTIAQSVADRFAANPQGLPQRAQVRLPIMQRLLARLQEAPGDPDILSDLAGTLDLQYDPTTQTFPRRYQTVEGGRLTRRRRPPQPADVVPRRTKPTTEVSAVSPLTAGTLPRTKPSDAGESARESFTAGLTDAESLLTPSNQGMPVSQPETLQVGVKSGIRLPKPLADLIDSQPIIDESSKQLDIERIRLVMPRMLSMIKQREIFDPVIKAVPVDVMNMLTSEQVSAELLRHNPTVFVNELSLDAKIPVAIRLLAFLYAVHKPSSGAALLYAIQNTPSTQLVRDVLEPERPPVGQAPGSQVPAAGGRPRVPAGGPEAPSGAQGAVTPPQGEDAAPLARALEIEKEFGLSPQDAAFYNIAIDAVKAAPGKWTTFREGLQKEAMRVSVATGGDLATAGDLQTAKRIADRYFSQTNEKEYASGKKGGETAPRPVAPAQFIGWQQIPGRPSLPMFRLTADLNERQKAGSTVMGPTLEAAGFSLPEYAPEETTPAPASVPLEPTSIPPGTPSVPPKPASIPATPPSVPPPAPTPPATQDIPFEPPPQPPPEPAPAAPSGGESATQALSPDDQRELAKLGIAERKQIVAAMTKEERRLYNRLADLWRYGRADEPRVIQATARINSLLLSVWNKLKTGEVAPPTRKARPAEERPWDLIDEYEGQSGQKISLTLARKLIEDFSPVGAARALFTSKGGVAPDVAAQGANFEGGEVALLEALNATAEARKTNRTRKTQERRELAAEIGQRQDFEQAALQPAAKPGEPVKSGGIVVNEFTPGDQFELAGEKVTVQEMVFDPESGDLAYVALEDGRRFGTQTVGSEQLIYPDEGTIKPTDKPAEFLPEEPLTLATPESVEEQKTRLAKEAETAKAKADRETVAAKAAKPLTGGTGTLGQGALFGSSEDLFAPPSPPLALEAEETGRPRDARYDDVLANEPTVAAMLDAIIERSTNPFYRAMAARFKAKGVSPQLLVTSRSNFWFQGISDATQGAYNSNRDLLWLATESVDPAKTFLHEMVHAATAKEILNPDSPVTKELQTLFDEVSNNPGLKGRYGMVNLQEFVAEAYSNLGFQDALNRIGTPTSLWRRFVNAIRRLLGLSVEQESMLERLMRVSAPAFSGERPTGGGPILESRLEAFESVDALEEFLRQPTIEPEVEAQMRTAAGAQAGLVSDAILNRILAIDNTNAIGRRQRSLLDFVLKLRNLAPIQQIQTILASNLKPEVKDAAVSAVLRQIEHVKAKTEEYGLALEKAMGRLENLQKGMERYDGTALTQNVAAESARSLLNLYRGYLSSRAAQLPADANLAAGRRDALDRMGRVITGWEKTPAAIESAIQAIARNIDALPLTSGVQAVLDAIRTRGILQGVGPEVVDLLTAPQPNGLPPLLSSREFLDSLKDLQRVQVRAGSLAKEIQTFEDVFAGSKEPTPVNLRRWAESYRKWRNTQAEASAVLRQFNREYKQADEDFEVYSGSAKVLTDLQDDSVFKAAYEAALESPNVLYKDIAKADPITKETLYIGPVSKKEFRINLSPDKIADDQAVANMQELLDEIDQFLARPDVDPLLAQTWQFRRDYIRRWVFFPQFHKLIRPDFPVWGTNIRIPWSPFELARKLAGGHLRAARSELAWMGVRAAKDAEHWYELGDFVSSRFRQLRNDREFGDAAISIAILKALKSHHWDADRLKYWNTYVLNEIIASQQNVGQLRLKEGKWIHGIQITTEDMAVARLQKRYTNHALSITQKGAQKTPLQFYNPLQIEDKFANLNVTRNALGPGPMTMARSLGEFGENFAVEWSSKKSLAEKLAMIADGQNFHLTVMGHIRETNPEYGSKSPHQRFYTELADLASRDPDYNFTSLDQLVDWLATRAVDSNLYDDIDTAREQVTTELVREIDGAAKAFLTILSDSRAKAPTENPQAALEQASAQNSFTRPRVRLVAPSTWYDYTLSTDVHRTAYLASGYQIFQLNQLQALEALQLALERKRTEYQKIIDAMTASGTSRRRAISTVQKQSLAETERQETRFSYKRLVEYINTLTIIRKHLTELVIDQRTPFDGAVIFSMSKVQGLLSSALLAQGQAISTNVLGGAITTQFIFEQNIGRARLLTTPIRLGKEFAKIAVKRLLILAPAKSIVGKALRANIPGFTAIAQYITDQQAEMVEFYNRAFQAGIVNPQDTAGRSKAMSELRTSGGRIEFDDPPALAKVTNWLESIPGIRRFLLELRDKSPRAADDVINLAGMNALRKSQFDPLKLEAITAFQAREQAGKSNDFSKEVNLLEPGELGFRTSRGYRDLEATRRLFSSIGLLDSVLLDYYQRWKAAPVDQRPDVPFLADPGEELQLIFEVAAMTNLPTAGYTPPIMQGVGYKGVLKGFAFMFANYGIRLGQQADFLGSVDPRDPEWKRGGAAAWSVITALLVVLLIGMLAREPGQELVELTTGRASSQLRLANVLADPNLESLSRYAGIAIASNFPFYGQVISQLLGNPGYGEIGDLTNMIPVAGMVRDLALTGKRVWETGQVGYPATDFIRRWFPPVAPVMRFLPELGGDVQARNASRALTAVAPKEMDLVRDRSQGGSYRQTPATVAMRSLISAAYRGDAEGVQESYQRAVAEREEGGSADPVQATLQSLAAQTPSRKVFGRLITPAEENRLIGRMSGSQRADYEASRAAFDLINRTLNTDINLIKEPEAPRVATRRTSRTRATRSRLPSLRRGSSRRRSPFGVSRLGARRRRRVPSFSFSS